MKQKTFYEKEDINILSLEFSKKEYWYIRVQLFQDQKKMCVKRQTLYKKIFDNVFHCL